MNNVVKYWKDFLSYFNTLETYRDSLWLKNPSLKCLATISNSDACEKSGLSTLISENLEFMYDWPVESICAFLFVITLFSVQVRNIS